MAQMYSRPSSSFGYWRGGMSDGPLAQGQGSKYGQPNQGVGMFPPGSGPVNGGRAWSPTLTYLLVLVAAEMILVKVLEKVLRLCPGGSSGCWRSWSCSASSSCGPCT